jgi:hypothetical protein
MPSNHSSIAVSSKDLRGMVSLIPVEKNYKELKVVFAFYFLLAVYFQFCLFISFP